MVASSFFNFPALKRGCQRRFEAASAPKGRRGGLSKQDVVLVQRGHLVSPERPNRWDLFVVLAAGDRAAWRIYTLRSTRGATRLFFLQVVAPPPHPTPPPTLPSCSASSSTFPQFRLRINYPTARATVGQPVSMSNRQPRRRKVRGRVTSGGGGSTGSVMQM